MLAWITSAVEQSELDGARLRSFAYTERTRKLGSQALGRSKLVCQYSEYDIVWRGQGTFPMPKTH